MDEPTYTIRTPVRFHGPRRYGAEIYLDEDVLRLPIWKSRVGFASEAAAREAADHQVEKLETADAKRRAREAKRPHDPNN
jgi:hypothetical protein